MTLGEKIISLRKQRGLSQEELAITLGISRQAVSKWETEDATPDTDKVIALADYFNVTTDWLLRDIELSAPESKTNSIASVAEMLRGAPMLLNLTIGGNVFGAALMIYDLWQQTYYHIPTIVGLFIQIGMCTLFLGLCSSIQTQDNSTERQWQQRYWRCNIYALALMPSFWAASITLNILAQCFPVSTLLLLPMTTVIYVLVCARMHFVTRGVR